MKTRFEYSAGAFVYRMEGGRIMLLVLRKQNGEYDLPKGHIEEGEHSEGAAKREIKEETGLDVGFVPFFHRDTKYFFYKDQQRIAKGVRFFLANVTAGKVRISHEHRGYEWLTPERTAERLGYKDLVPLIPQVAEYIRRFEAMERINRDYSALPRTVRGWDLSRRFVPGEGRLDANIMLVGQAPGANEDETGRPFVGRSGKLLDSVLRRAHIRREDAYILSAVQFFPPKNRLPAPKEVSLCRPFFERQLELIKPRYVVLLGNLASASVLGIGQVEKNHGRIISRDGIKYLITFHPAAALRFRDKIALMDRDFDRLGAEMKKD